MKDINAGSVGYEGSSQEIEEASSTSNSQSESDSQTNVNIKSSVADVQKFVEAEDGKSNLRKCL